MKELGWANGTCEEEACEKLLPPKARGEGKVEGGGCDKTVKDFAVNDITEQKLSVLAKGTRDRR